MAILCFHLMTDFNITSYKFEYGNVLEKFVFQHYRAKVKVTVAVAGKFCHCSGPLLFRLILV